MGQNCPIEMGWDNFVPGETVLSQGGRFASHTDPVFQYILRSCLSWDKIVLTNQPGTILSTVKCIKTFLSTAMLAFGRLAGSHAFSRTSQPFRTCIYVGTTY